MSYTDKSKVESYLQTTISSSYDSWLTIIISAVKIWIDKYTGKTFEYVNEDRYYDGARQKDILIDDFTGTPVIVLLNEDGTTDSTLDSDDYLLYPLNSSVKNIIHLKDGAPYSRFSSQTKRVKVTANFGVAQTVPADIQLAATQLVANLYNAGTSDGEVQSESLGDYSVTFRSIDEASQTMGVKSILDNYRDIDI